MNWGQEIWEFLKPLGPIPTVISICLGLWIYTLLQQIKRLTEVIEKFTTSSHELATAIEVLKEKLK